MAVIRGEIFDRVTSPPSSATAAIFSISCTRESTPGTTSACNSLETYHFYQKQLAACVAQLQRFIPALPDRGGADVEHMAQPGEPAGKQRKAKSRRKAKNYPSFDLAAELQRKTGVDLTTIDGINVLTAQTISGELGAARITCDQGRNFGLVFRKRARLLRRMMCGGKLICAGGQTPSTEKR